jgi:hypothetical protein
LVTDFVPVTVLTWPAGRFVRTIEPAELWLSGGVAVS